MPSGVYKRTNNHKANISKALIGKKHSSEWSEKIAITKRGTHHSIDSKRKIAEGNRGKVRTPEMREKYRIASTINMKKRLRNGWKQITGMKGLKHSEATKNKMSEMRRGDKHWKWAGGITPINLQIRHSKRYILWRNSVFSRDNWTCQKCKIKGGKLVAHHIKNFSQFPNLRFSLSNGITFHELHHIEFHKIYGKTNNNRRQIKEYI